MGLFALFLPLLLMFAATLNFKIGVWLFPGFYCYDIKRFLELLLLFYFAGGLFFLKRVRIKALLLFHEFPFSTQLGLLIILGLGLMSVLFSAVPHMAILQYCLYILLFGGALFVAALAVENEEFVSAGLLLTILSGGAIYILTFFLFYGLNVTWKMVPVFIGFSNYRFLSQYLVWLLPFAVLPVLDFKQDKFLKVIYFICYALLAAIAIANGAKGMYLGFGLGFLVVALLFRGRCKQWFKAQLLFAATGFGLYIVLFQIITQLSKLSHLNGSAHARWLLWKGAVKVMFEHPWLGIGPMHLAHLLNPIATHPHNSVLQIGAEWGGIALALLLFLAAKSAWAWGRKFNYKTVAPYSESKQFLLMSLTMSLVGGLAYSLCSGVIVMPLSQIMFMLIGGWMVGIYYSDNKYATSSITVLKQVLFLFFVAIVVMVFLFFLVPQIIHLQVMESDWALKNIVNGRILFHPRFWQQGWF